MYIHCKWALGWNCSILSDLIAYVYARTYHPLVGYSCECVKLIYISCWFARLDTRKSIHVYSMSLAIDMSIVYAVKQMAPLLLY